MNIEELAWLLKYPKVMPKYAAKNKFDYTNEDIINILNIPVKGLVDTKGLYEKIKRSEQRVSKAETILERT